ncbi:hypothetical protein ABNF48_13140, partial [Paenibacillus larvae]
RAMNMAPFIFWNLAFYTIIRTQLNAEVDKIVNAVSATMPLVIFFLNLIKPSPFFDFNKINTIEII